MSCLWVLNERRVAKFLENANSKINIVGTVIRRQLLQDISANSLNPIRDIQLPMLAAMRKNYQDIWYTEPG